MKSTVGTELPSLVAGDSPEASDRAAVQIPCCHGAQRKAESIRVSHVSVVADGHVSGPSELCKDCNTQRQQMQDCDKLAASKGPEAVTRDSRQDEVDEELCYQSGAGSPPHMQSFPIEIAARSITATPRVEHVGIVAESPISGGVKGEPKKQQLGPERQRLEMPSEEELDVLLERNDEADDDLMAEYELEQMMVQKLEEEQAEEELTEASSADRAGTIKGPEPDVVTKPAEQISRDKTGSANLLEAAMKKAASLKAARATAGEVFALSVFYCKRAMPRATARRRP